MQKKLKSEENTIYLFDFEPNIRDFQEWVARKVMKLTPKVCRVV
jgi:hypothetical protein